MDPSVRAISEEDLLENLAWVQTLARRLVRDPGRADDVAQDAWLKALERPPRETTGATLRAWLTRVVRSVARESLRAESLRRWREFAAARDATQPSASDVVARSAMQQRLIEAVMALGEPDRTIVLLRYMDGLSSPAIAARRGETPAAVRKRLSRALGRLRERFAREYGDDNNRWIHALAPLAFGGGGDATKVALGEFVGGALVSKTSWIVGMAAAVVALMAVGWFFLDGARPSSSPAGGGGEPSALPSVEPSARGPVEEITPKFEGLEQEEFARVPVDANAPPPGPTYVLTDPDGRPVTRAELLLCRDGAVLARGETDASGHFAPELDDEGEAKLLAIASGWPAQVHEVSLAPETHELSLYPGAVLSGRIVVDDAWPAERIPLRIVAEQVLLDFEEVLGAPAAAFRVSGTLWRMMRTQAAEDGSFRFDGLPIGWAGSLELPQDYALTDAMLIEFELNPWRMRLNEPTEHLRIEVTKRLALKGRVVDHRGGVVVPLPDVLIYGSIEYDKPSKQPYYTPQTFTDHKGRFRFHLESSVVRGGSLYLSTRDNTLSRQFELEPREIEEDWDLGDVPLVDPATTRTIRLVVLDPLGAPIAGAVAGVDISSPISDPTDSEGRTALRGVVPGGKPVVVHAVGFQVEEIAVPEDVPEEFVVEMKKGTGLELHLVGADGAPMRRLQACFQASRHPVRQGTMYPASIRALLAAGCGTYHWDQPDEEPGVLRIYTDRDGLVVANDLEPGVPLKLRIRAMTGEVLDERDLARLASGEWRRIDIELGDGPGEFRGRVLDEAGNPVSGASVEVSSLPTGERQGGLQTMSSGVGADGNFTLRGLYCTTVSLWIRASGFASLSIQDYELPMDDTPVDFRLEAGHDVMVHVTDREGRPVPARLSVRLEGAKMASHVRGVEVEVGTYLLRDLPSGELTIRARVHGLNYLRSHDPLVSELRIEVPVLGALEVTIRDAGELELDDDCHLWLLPARDSDAVRRYGILDPTGESPVLLLDILPGTYEAVLRRRHRPEEIPSELRETWFEDFPDEQFDELTPRVPVTIQAVKTTRVEIPR